MILFQLIVMIYMVATGLKQASSAIIGKYIGSGDIYYAKVYYKTFVQVTIVIIFILNLIVYKYQA